MHSLTSLLQFFVLRQTVVHAKTDGERSTVTVAASLSATPTLNVAANLDMDPGPRVVWDVAD